MSNEQNEQIENADEFLYFAPPPGFYPDAATVVNDMKKKKRKIEQREYVNVVLGAVRDGRGTQRRRDPLTECTPTSPHYSDS